MDPSITRLPRLRTVYVDKVVFKSIMAEHFYSVKTALRVGIAQILAGLTSIGIGAYNTRNENHEAFIEFKPEGLPVWSGALFLISGGVGCLSYKRPKKSTIHVFLMLCILVAITSILMYWIIMPLIVKGEKPIEWNLYFGAFLGIVALIFVVSMKGSFVAFKASFFQYNCLSKAPQTQDSEPVELDSSSACMIRSTSLASDDTQQELREGRRVSRTSRSQRQASSMPHPYSNHSTPYSNHSAHSQHRPRGHSSQRSMERETRMIQIDTRPPPPPYQTLKLPHLPSYTELEISAPPPPYREKKDGR